MARSSRTMTISPPCPIGSLLHLSAPGRTNRSPMLSKCPRTQRQTPRSPMSRGSNSTPIIGAVRTIEAAFRIDRTGRATAFQTAGLVPTDNLESGMRGIVTIDRTAMAGRASFVRIEILRPNPNEKQGAKLHPEPALPSFITGEPKSGFSDPNGPPVSEQGATPAVVAPNSVPETNAELAETAPSDAMFQGRGRRRRLRSPYGFNARPAAEEDPEAPATKSDETSATE